MHKSLPKELIESLRGIKGFDEEAFLRVHESGEQVTSVRYNPGKGGMNNDQWTVNNDQWSMVNGQWSSPTIPVPWCRHGVYLPERPSFTFDPHFHAGVYYVQEPSSMFLWRVLEQTIGANTKGLKVLDLCAAPGGKSTLLASYFPGSLIVANEVIRSRANILVENITKWGCSNVIVTNNDPKDFTKLEGYFDVIVVDAPCSGSGLFRKENDAINEWSPDAVKLCSLRQQRILADVYPALKKDGLLIYATCSYSKEEDEDMLDWLAEAFTVESYKLTVKEEIIETYSEKSEGYGYRFFPDKIKGEGFFIAAFRKMDGDHFIETKQNILPASREEINIAGEWVDNNIALSFIKQKNNIIAVDVEWMQDTALLQKNLYLRKAGVCVGEMKGKDFIPNHELALSLLINKNLPVMALNKEQAIEYLKKKEIKPDSDCKGWSLANYEGSNLGWMKLLQNRINNYYPKEWRILKQ